MAMISSALITGGAFIQNVDQRQTLKSAIDRLEAAVAHAAFHNSGARFDPPRCHPNTRIAVRDKLEKWALGGDPATRDTPILWLSGAAGAGKSAIAQTLAEDFHSKGLLLASFFFGRSDSTRNHAQALVSTIVYQLYNILPHIGNHLWDVIDHDSLIFTKSLLAQFEALIVKPLLPLMDSGFWADTNSPRLIIIDGLDECMDRGMQRNVLLLLSASVHRFRLPFRFLLASRPEHDIQAVFSSPHLLPIHTRLFLDDSYLPDHDIELFLLDQFDQCRTTHPFKHLIPTNWPSDEDVEHIREKSSGQFIYASVVAKYVRSPRHRPHHRLDVVLSLRPASRDLPFSELDELYTRIFSEVEDIDRVLKLLSFFILGPPVPVIAAEQILELDEGEISMALCDLASLIDSSSPHDLLSIHHASLLDYLTDQTRSRKFYVNQSERLSEHVAQCFRFLSHIGPSAGPAWQLLSAPYAMYLVESYITSLNLTESLSSAIRCLSISRLYTAVFQMPRGPPPISAHRDLRGRLLLHYTHSFVPAVFRFLSQADSTDHASLLRQQQTEFDALIVERLKGCSLGIPALVLALVAAHDNLPYVTFDYRFHLYDYTALEASNRLSFPLLSVMTGKSDHMRYLSEFLRDPTRSQEVCAGPELYAQAAKQCLSYLCDRTATERRHRRRLSPRLCQRRKYTPWKWRCRRSLDIRGWRSTPWLWVERLGSLNVVNVVLNRKARKPIYIHTLIDASMGWQWRNNVVSFRVMSEKFYLALVYLLYFLRRAAKLDDLVDMCETLAFASGSQEWPRKSAKARRCMQNYVARCT